MTQPRWTFPVLLAGLALALAGPWLVGILVPEQVVWSNQQADELNKARAGMHGSLHENGLHHERASTTEETFNRHDAGREAALSRRGWLIMGARILGIVLAGVGVAGYLVGRR
jgi:hypothetical protein